MIYRFILLSDEADNFYRELEINSDATFLDLHNLILDSVHYTKDQITSFFVCSDRWEKKQEITLIEMDTNADEDLYLMEDTHLDEFIHDKGDRLLYTFDNVADRSFFIELKGVKPGHNAAPLCTQSEGVPPKQLVDEADFLAASAQDKADSYDSEFYGDSDFDMDELDEEGFGDVSIDDINDLY